MSKQTYLLDQEAQRMLGQKISLDMSIVIQEGMFRSAQKQFAALDDSYEALLIYGVMINDKKEIRRVIEAHFDNWNAHPEVKYRHEIFFQFTGLFTKLAHFLGRSVHDYVFGDQMRLWKHPELFRSINEIKDWWTARFYEMSESYEGFRIGRKTKIIQLVAHYVDIHVFDNITRDEVANHVYINPSYLSRLFKEVTGETFSNFVLRKKMEKAIHLLHVERVMVYEVANRLGYKDASYFARIFKRYTGKSPSDFQC